MLGMKCPWFILSNKQKTRSARIARRAPRGMTFKLGYMYQVTQRLSKTDLFHKWVQIPVLILFVPSLSHQSSLFIKENISTHPIYNSALSECYILPGHPTKNIIGNVGINGAKIITMKTGEKAFCKWGSFHLNAFNKIEARSNSLKGHFKWYLMKDQ